MMADNVRETCIICQIVGGRIPSKKVYEDDLIMAVLDVNGANPGHSFVIPKNHYPIIEQVPDSEIGKMFQISNKILISIQLLTFPKQLSEEEMSTVELKLKDSAKNVGGFDKEKKNAKVSAPKPV